MSPRREQGTTKNSSPLRQQKQDRESKQQDAVQEGQLWTKGICPNCGDAEAEVDPDGVLWCCACGYSKKGCYT
ncbi:MAG: hypothetical protein HS126_16245 [Anaerolineales bacterium]|nr:hypothetical protein [Anaerolineales bacterium]